MQLADKTKFPFDIAPLAHRASPPTFTISKAATTAAAAAAAGPGFQVGGAGRRGAAAAPVFACLPACRWPALLARKLSAPTSPCFAPDL